MRQLKAIKREVAVSEKDDTDILTSNAAIRPRINRSQVITDSNLQNNTFYQDRIKTIRKQPEPLPQGRIIRNSPSLITPANHPALSSRQSLSSNPSSFVHEYNAIENSGKTSYELKNSRSEYFQKCSMTGFYCENHEKRMNDPTAPPIFKTATSQEKSSFWAMHLREQSYAVVPNPKGGYESQLHEAGAMKQAFDSNYQGGSYSRINVDQPAVFNRSGDQWILVSKGRLRLER